MSDPERTLSEGDVRSLAVAVVDGIHGYTFEFSGSPGGHLADYDNAESIITSELRRLGHLRPSNPVRFK